MDPNQVLDDFKRVGLNESLINDDCSSTAEASSTIQRLKKSQNENQKLKVLSGVSVVLVVTIILVALFQSPTREAQPIRAAPATLSAAQMSFFAANQASVGYDANFTVKYVQVDELNDTSMDGALEMYTTSNQECTYVIEKKQQHVPEPMPHQLILCINKAEGNDDTFDISQCASSYMIISLFNPKYFFEHETLLMNELKYDDVHAYMQGKFLQSMFSENKLTQDQSESIKGHVSSFGVHEVEGVMEAKAKAEAEKDLGDAGKAILQRGFCEAMRVQAGGFPVCGTVKILYSVCTHMWDLAQNTPSSQSGWSQTFFEHKGLGGDVETVFIQLYDPYNFPAANLYEWDSCQGESASLGARNFTIDSTGKVYEQPYAAFALGYPAKNANSFIVPYNVQLDLYDDDELQATLKCENATGCGCMTAMKNGKPHTYDFNNARASYLNLWSMEAFAMKDMIADYQACLKTSTEKQCAARVACLEANNYRQSACQDVSSYVHKGWVSGNCNQP